MVNWLVGAAQAQQAGEALAVGERLNLALTGNLQQPPCSGSSAVNESCYSLVYIL